MWEAEAGGSGVQGQPGQHSKTLSQKSKKQTNKKKVLLGDPFYYFL
jgi:hypothetical protein